MMCTGYPRYSLSFFAESATRDRITTLKGFPPTFPD